MGEEEGQVIENELENPLYENHIILDYGQNTMIALKDSISLARKLLWIDNISL